MVVGQLVAGYFSVSDFLYYETNYVPADLKNSIKLFVVTLLTNWWIIVLAGLLTVVLYLMLVVMLVFFFFLCITCCCCGKGKELSESCLECFSAFMEPLGYK